MVLVQADFESGYSSHQSRAVLYSISFFYYLDWGWGERHQHPDLVA